MFVASTSGSKASSASTALRISFVFPAFPPMSNERRIAAYLPVHPAISRPQRR
jgi:hypothetical protein